MLVCNMKSSAYLKNQFLTHFPINKQPIWTMPKSFVFLGSCFSTNISNLFEQHFIPSFANPFGTIFSPDAIAQSLHHIESQTLPEIITYQNREYALLFDSKFSNTNKSALEATILATLTLSLEKIKNADTVFITLGSAWVYEHLESKKLVGNCHKIPQSQFQKRLLGVDEIAKNIQHIELNIRKINPKCKLIFTISPVRHLRDGIIENTLSKSLLVSALHLFLAQNETCRYFPSFEIFNEELKDHRFFETDLAHPNNLAIEYIFSRLIETYGKEDFLNYLEQANKLKTQINHRIKSEDAEEIAAWNNKVELAKQEFKLKYPAADLSL